MVRWSKSKPQLETKLPPLTTDGDATTNWHRQKTNEEPAPAALWSVTWDTSRQAEAFNTAHQSTETEAIDCARKFLKMGFIVYSIKDASGFEVMNEATIAKRFKPETFD